MSHRTHYALVTSGLAVALALAGCSSGNGDKDAPSIATLQSAGVPTSAPAGQQRPIYPIDATYEQIGAMAKPWLDCLKKQGATKLDEALGLLQKGGDAKDLGLVGLQGDAGAWKACELKQPESSDDNLLRTNPTEYKDNQREWYRCAQAAGYKLTAPDPETGEFGLTEVGPNGDFGSEKITECRRKAFAN